MSDRQPFRPGVYAGLRAGDYHADPSIGSGEMRALIQSVAHYLHLRDHPPDETEAMIKGSLLHKRILEPEEFSAVNLAIKPPDMKFTTKEGKAWKGEMEASGKIIITQEAHDEIAGMSEAIMAHPWAREALTGGESEVSIFAIDLPTELLLKARPDYIIEYEGSIFLVDIKTMRPPVYPPGEFERAMHYNGYHIQAAHYNYCYRLATGKPVAKNYIVAVENIPPYGVMVYEIAVDALARAAAQIDIALKKLKDFNDSGEGWVGYPCELITADLPRWVYNQ